MQKKASNLSLIMITDIDTTQFAKETKDTEKPKYFAIIKESALLTYFTDKKVMTEVLKYVKVPGKYDGNYAVDQNEYDTIYGLGV